MWFSCLQTKHLFWSPGSKNNFNFHVLFMSVCVCVCNYYRYFVCGCHDIWYSSLYIDMCKTVLSCWFLISNAFLISCICTLLFWQLLVLTSYLCVDEFLPLLYICLYWWTFLFIMSLFLVAVFSFPTREVSLAFVVKLV